MGKTRNAKSLGRTGLAALAIGLICSGALPSGVAMAETPLWQLGIPTFSGKKPEEQAQAGPSFHFPPPTSEIAQLPAGATGPLKQPGSVEQPGPTERSIADVQPAAYQINSGTVLSGATAAVVSPGLPMPPLPAAAQLDLPVAPAGTALPVPPAADPSTPIGQALATGAAVESAPLAEETASWYEIPWRWVTRGWKNHAELGLDGSSGNSRTLALQTGLEMKRKTERYTLGIDFDYRKATNRGLTTEDNGRLNLDYDRLFQDSKWSAFGKFGAEWDQFKAFDSRLNLNSGLGYHFIRTDDAMFATRFGAGASKEIGAPDDDWKPEAVFGAEGEYQLNRYNKMKAKVDYFPAWEDFSDYRVVSDVAWEILLDDTDNLSLKLALTDRYDSTPQGAKPNDVYYSLLLLVKF